MNIFKNKIKQSTVIESITVHIKKMQRLKSKYDILCLLTLSATMSPLAYYIFMQFENHSMLKLMAIFAYMFLYLVSNHYCEEHLTIKMPKLKNKFLFLKDKEIQYKLLHEMEKKNSFYFEKIQILLTKINTSLTDIEQWKYINQLHDIIIKYNKKVVDTQELMSEYKEYLKENNLLSDEKEVEIEGLKKYL